MTQSTLFDGQETQPKGRFELGKGYALHLPHGPRGLGQVYHQGRFSKQVNLRDKAERRILVVELMQKGVNQVRLAEALRLSRQTLHNYRESYVAFGVEGLLHGYRASDSRSRELQRRLHVDKRRAGSKARELEAQRRARRASEPKAEQGELAWDGEAALCTLEEVPLAAALEARPAVGDALAEAEAAPPCEPLELPYGPCHDWEASRYAGIFPILLVLVGQWQWLHRVMPLFGNGWRLFMVFVLMAVRNIRSIEQLKHARHEEAGRPLGLGRLPALRTLWGWFHEAAARQRAGALLEGFFADQIRDGRVGARLWFTDGHLLPYTGGQKVHAAYHTQRRMPTPGQTNLVTCDERGRILQFEIQEGKGDLRERILWLGAYAREQQLTPPPVHVFDREGDGLGFFSALVSAGTPFITWEKNADAQRLAALEAEAFTHRLHLNGTNYRLLEQTKACTYRPETGPEQRFDLRRVVLWNLRTHHRAGVLCWDGGLGLSPEEVATGMLSRWGASENTFKHLQARHPYHYHPGFGVSESEKQDIANPQIKALAQQLSALKGRLVKLYKQHAKTRPSFNRDGSERANSRHRRLSESMAAEEAEQQRLAAEKAALPERVEVSGLADYRSFQVIDNEGKKLFDFVTASVWNARRQLIDWLEDSYAKDSDRVDLLYAILHCHGWIRSDAQWVVVRLEPLQQPTRRYAQEQLCRKLTGLGARIPGGKWLRIEVGDAPV